MLDNVKLIKYDYTDVFEQIVNVKDEDVIIGISLPRYTSRTVDIVKYAKEKGATVLAITDSKNSPIGEIADEMILAMSNMSSIVDSLVAPLSVINALIVAVGSKKKEEVNNKFEDFEKLWKMKNTFKDKF
jgi:transcriptional regulator